MSLLDELRRRNVIRVAGFYLVAAWLVVQVAETLLPAFDVPGWVLRAIIVLLALGFAAAVVLACGSGVRVVFPGSGVRVVFRCGRSPISFQRQRERRL